MRLSSLQELAAFEATGRRRSFGGAARGLGVSQPAASQQAAWLEAGLGRAAQPHPRRVAETGGAGLIWEGRRAGR